MISVNTLLMSLCRLTVILILRENSEAHLGLVSTLDYQQTSMTQKIYSGLVVNKAIKYKLP